MKSEYDFSGFICPLSLVKAVEVIDSLGDGEMVKLILGDSNSLKSVVGELKVRGIKPGFAEAGKDRFVLTVTK